jgi:hypothetical protein
MTTEKPIRVFQVNEADYIAARTMKEAVRYLQKCAGLPLDEAFDKDCARTFTDTELDKLIFVNEDDESEVTFLEQLVILINQGADFPHFFASTEY